MTTRISGRRPRAISQKGSAVKRQITKKHSASQNRGRALDPEQLQAQTAQLLEDRDGAQYLYPPYDGSMGQSPQLPNLAINPNMGHTQFADMNQLNQASHVSSQYPEAFGGGAYPVAMDQDGLFYAHRSHDEMGQSIQPNMYIESEVNPQIMDQHNFYYGDFGGSAAITDAGVPSMDGETGQYYDHVVMHQGLRNFHGELGGAGYNGEDSFPGSQHQPIYRSFPYPYQQSSYGGQEGVAQIVRGSEGIDGFERDVNGHEEFMRLPTEQLLQAGVIPSLPRRDAAAMIIEEQDRQGMHGISFQTDNEAQLQQNQIRFNRHAMSSSQGFHQISEHTPEPIMNVSLGPNRGVASRQRVQQSAKNTSGHGNHSNRSGPRQNNFIVPSDVEIEAKESTQENKKQLERQTFGSQVQSNHNQSLNRNGKEEMPKRPQGSNKQVQGSGSSKKPPKPYQSQDQAQMNDIINQNNTQNEYFGQQSLQQKDYRLHGDSPKRLQRQLEVARENSAKGKRSQQASLTSINQFHEKEVLETSREETDLAFERPKKQIDLKESELQQFSQPQYPNTARLRVNKPASFSPQNAEAENKKSEQQIRPPSEEMQIQTQEPQQIDTHSPEFNNRRETSLLTQAQGVKNPEKIVINDQQQTQIEIPLSLGQTERQQSQEQKIQQPIEEPRQEGLVISQQNRLQENRIQDAKEGQRRGHHRSTGSGLVTDRSLQASGIERPSSREGQVSTEEQIENDRSRRRPSRNHQTNQESMMSSNIVETRGGQITVTPASNEDFTNELSEGGTQPTRIQRARTVMIKQPSSGETASQFHDNDSPKYGKLSQPPRDSIQSINQGTINDNNVHSLSPPQQQQNGVSSKSHQQSVNPPANQDQNPETSQRSQASRSHQQLPAKMHADQNNQEGMQMVHTNFISYNHYDTAQIGNMNSVGKGQVRSSNMNSQIIKEDSQIVKNESIFISNQAIVERSGQIDNLRTQDLNNVQKTSNKHQIDETSSFNATERKQQPSLSNQHGRLLQSEQSKLIGDQYGADNGIQIQSVEIKINSHAIDDNHTQPTIELNKETLQKKSNQQDLIVSQIPSQCFTENPWIIDKEIDQNGRMQPNLSEMIDDKQFQRSYTLGNESEKTNILQKVEDSDLNVNGQFLSASAQRYESKYQRETSYQAQSPSMQSNAQAPTVQEISINQDQNIIFNRKNTNMGSMETESILNQDMSSKQGKSPQLRVELSGSKHAEPQVLNNIQATPEQSNLDQREVDNHVKNINVNEIMQQDMISKEPLGQLTEQKLVINNEALIQNEQTNNENSDYQQYQKIELDAGPGQESDGFQESIRDEVMRSLRRDNLHTDVNNDSQSYLQVEDNRREVQVSRNNDQDTIVVNKLQSNETPIKGFNDQTQTDQMAKNLMQDEAAQNHNDESIEVVHRQQKDQFQNIPVEEPIQEENLQKANLERNIEQLVPQIENKWSQKQLNDIDKIFKQFENESKREFIDDKDIESFSNAKFYIINNSFEDTISDAQIKQANLKSELASEQTLQLPRTKSQHRFDFGQSWIAAMQSRYLPAKIKQRSLSECSSLLSVRVHRIEEVQSYDLQMIYDFDFETACTFRMHRSIDQSTWTEILQQRLNLQSIDRMELIKQSLLEKKKMNEQVKLPSIRNQALYESNLQSHQANVASSRALNQIQNDNEDASKQKNFPKIQLLNSIDSNGNDQLSDNNEDVVQTITEAEALRLYKKHRMNQGSLVTLQDGTVALTQRTITTSKRVPKQTFIEQKAVFKQRMKNQKIQKQLTSRRQSQTRKTMRNSNLTPRIDAVVEGNLVLDRSQSPRHTISNKLVEKNQMKRYFSPQAGNKVQKMTKQQILKDNIRLEADGISRLRKSLKPQSKQMTDKQGQDAGKRLSGQQIDGRLNRNYVPEGPNQDLHSLVEINQDMDLGDEDGNQIYGGQLHNSDQWMGSQFNEYYDEEDSDQKMSSSASNLFGSPSNQMKKDAIEFENNSDYEQFLRELKANGLQIQTQQLDKSIALSQDVHPYRLNEDQADHIFKKIDFFIENSNSFFRKELDLIQRKDLKTVKPEAVRINQKIVYRIDYDIIFNQILNEDHELIEYLCKGRRHFIHLKNEHQHRLDDVLFEGSLFVHLLKQSKPLKIEGNNIADTASQIGSRIKNLSSFNKRLRQDVLNKNSKKPLTPKNKVEKFLIDLSIHQQDVLDIEKILPVLQNNYNIGHQTVKVPVTSTSIGSPVKQERIQSANNIPTIQIAQKFNNSLPAKVPVAIGLGSLATIQEDGVESANFQSIDRFDLAEATHIDSTPQAVQNQVENYQQSKLSPEDEDEKCNLKLIELNEFFSSQAYVNSKDKKKYYLNQKYIAIFHYFSLMTTSALFQNQHQNCIYYKIDQILNRVPRKYFEHIKKFNLDQWQLHTERVQKQGTNSTDNRLSIFDAGFPNLKYQFSQDYTLNVFIKRLMYQQRPVMEQIKQMIFQSKQCLLIQNLYPDYYQEKKEDTRSPICKAAGCQKDSKEDLILNKFNELYYLSCEKDDTYRFNIRQSFKTEGDNGDLSQKKGTFYDDQPQEYSSEDSDDHTSYMVNSYVNQAVQNDPQELTTKIRDKILSNIKQKKDFKKGIQHMPLASQDYQYEKKLRGKLRINARLQMVMFHEVDFEEDEEAPRKALISPQDNKIASPFMKKDELNDDGKDKKDEEPNSILNMPTRVISLQEAKQRDKQAQEAYPKFKLSKAFGYGQFISNDRLFEVYDTKLVDQAQKDAKTLEQKRTQREKNIQDKRELHQKKIKEMIKNNLQSKELFSTKIGKYKLDKRKEDQDKFVYRMMPNGKNKICIATPKELLQAQQDLSGTMDTYVNVIISPRKFQISQHLKNQLIEKDKQQNNQKVTQSISEEQSKSQTAIQHSKSDNLLEVNEKELIQQTLPLTQHHQTQLSPHITQIYEKYSKHQNQLRISSVQRFEIYKAKFQQWYLSYPELLSNQQQSIEYENINEVDQDLEISSDKAENAVDTDRLIGPSAKGSLRLLAQSTGIVSKNDSGPLQIRALQINEMQSSSPLKDYEPGSSKQLKHKRQILAPTFNSQLKSSFTLRPNFDNSMKFDQDHSSANNFMMRTYSLAGIPENLPLNKNQMDEILDTRRSARSRQDQQSLFNEANDIFDVVSECDINNRPEMCRLKLEHIKQVYQNVSQERLEKIDEITILILRLKTESEEDDLMGQNLQERLKCIRERRQKLKDSKQQQIIEYQKQNTSSQMQLLSNLNFKSIELRDCTRIQTRPIQVIQILDNTPLIFRQRDIFAPIINKRLYMENYYVFQYDFRLVNEPQYKIIKNIKGSTGLKGDKNNNQIETFIFLDTKVGTGEDEDESNSKNDLGFDSDQIYLDQFENLSEDKMSEDQISSSEEDLDQPIMVRIENIRERKKRKQSSMHGIGFGHANAKNFKKASLKVINKKDKKLSVKQRSQTKPDTPMGEIAEETETQGRNTMTKAELQNSATTPEPSNDKARKRQNIKALENALSKDGDIPRARLTRKDLAQRHRELRQIITNKPVSFFDPNACKRLQEDVEKMNQDGQIEAQNSLMKPMNYQSQQNLPLKNLLSAVNKVMEDGNKRSQASDEEEGLLEQVSQKLRRAIEVNQPQVIQDFVVYNGRLIDLYDKDGYTLLCRAVHYGRSDIVELLLKAGADPNKTVRESEDTPLHIAVNFNFKKVQDLLLDHNANETLLNKKGLLPWEGIQHQTFRQPQQQ